MTRTKVEVAAPRSSEQKHTLVALVCLAGLALLGLAACRAPASGLADAQMFKGIPVGKDEPLAKESVALVDKDGDLMCSGSLIGKAVVATDEHCTVFNQEFLSTTFVVFGTDIRASWAGREKNGLVRGVRKLTLHGSSLLFEENKDSRAAYDAALKKFQADLTAVQEKFGESRADFVRRKLISFLVGTLPEDYDFALLFLDADAPADMRPLALASTKKFGAAKMGTPLEYGGFGWRFPAKPDPQIAVEDMKPDVPKGERAKGLLERATGSFLRMRPGSKGSFAAHTTALQARLCKGDSGGPGVVTDPADGKRYLMGITKLVYMDKRDGCGALIDQTDVRTFELWIRCNASEINGPGESPTDAQCLLPRLWAESVEKKKG